MKKALLHIMLMLLVILISCELKEDDSSTGGDPVDPTEESITVTSPVSGDTLTVGASHEIKWTSTTTGNLNIEYTTDNQKTWNLIASNIEDVGSYIWNPIPNKVSDISRIKVVTTDSTTEGISTGFFSIVEPPTKTITITSPNGGEYLVVGSNYLIEWTSTTVKNVIIEFSNDNGSTWRTIVESYPADSSKYNWDPIPNFTSNTSLIRISDVSENTTFDVSDAVFSISIPKEIVITAPNGGENWIGNSSQTITWFSSEVSDVKIEYTLNNGVNWFTLVESTPSDGFYTWDPLPNSPSTNAKVRITNVDGGFPSDESNSVFAIEPELFITVITPNGGEEWLSGSGHFIQWTTSTPDIEPTAANFVNPVYNREVNADLANNKGRNFSKRSQSTERYSQDVTSLSKGTGNAIQSISDVKIEFSTNNGASWTTITESTPNNGNFLWNPVPIHNSVLCVVRISDADDSVPFDISDESFTISERPTLEIIVTTPNGGEEWNSGTTQNIAWTSKGIESVDIDYSTNNGVDWISIDENVPSSGFYTWTQVPNTASNNCKIRIGGAGTGVPFDESNGTFSILPEPDIKIIAPNGGETLQTGTSNNITWTSENIANVKIELTTNNGATWSLITSSTESDGNYNWTNIPDLNSSLCKIRVSDADDNIPSDISDEVFNITNQVEESITLVTPNGGETWDASTSKLVTWTSNGISLVKIEFSSNNGISWASIADSVENTGSYDWTVPNINSTQGKIRVSDAEDNQPIDESNGTFTIRQAGYLKILKPETGDVWISGDLNKIEWEAENVEKIKIEFTMTDAIYDPNAEFFDDLWTTLTEDAPGAAGFYETRFTTAETRYRIRISDSDLDSPVDFSGLFTVKARPVKEIEVLSPNGGESLFAGASYSIEWTSSNVEFVDIELSTNNGASWEQIADSTESDGVYTWGAVPDLSSSLCKIRILDNSDPQFFDDSNFPFEIVNENQLLAVTSPNGAEIWQAGTTQDITWQTTGVQNVKIELTTNNGINWTTVVASTPSDGHYTWSQIPSTVSTNCKIKISDASDGMPSDDSDQFFTIAPEPGIIVLSPNGGENYLTGTSTSISWTSVNVANVKIEYTTNGGAEWNLIVASTGSDGSYLWENIPNLNSALCQVRISDASDGSPFDMSDGYFNITNQVEESLNIISPNGGEEFEAGTKQNITWQATGIAKVDVEFTTNNGLSWQPIANNIDNSGALEWSLALGINSPQCKVRVKDNDDSVPVDESDGTFVIKPAQSISVTSPQGGEVYEAGESITIEWNSTGIENVGIRYTTTNGLGSSIEPTFYTVVGSAPNTGSYETSFSIPSDRYYVEVYDASDASPQARSVGNFTVLPQVTNKITILAPNVGEQFLVNEIQEVRWTSEGVENVDIEYSVNGGATWNSVVSSTPSDGSYLWTVPNVPTSHNCKIRLSDVDEVSIFDESDGLFSIQQSFLRVTFPNGGELLDYDAGHFVTWESAGIGQVDIAISYNNGFTWDVIIEDYSNTGAYEWNPPDIATNLARIRVSKFDDPSISDISDGFFALDNDEEPFRSFIQITSPQKDVIYPSTSALPISWNNSRNIVAVDIDFSDDNGLTTIPLAANYTNIAWNIENTFNWLPTTTSDYCRVRITGYDEFGVPIAIFWSEPFKIQ